MTLTPAFGRDHGSKAEVLEAFLKSQDFILHDLSSPWDGKPINRPQVEEAGKTSVRVRYKRLTRVVVLSKTDDTWRAE